MFNRESVDGFEVEAILEELEEITEVESPETASQFPQDLGTANNILNMSLDFLMNDLVSSSNNPIPFNQVSTVILEI